MIQRSLHRRLGLTHTLYFPINPDIPEGFPLPIDSQSATPTNPVAGLTIGIPLDRVTCALALLTGFSIPLSTSFSEIATGLFMAAWFVSGKFAARWAAIRRNSVALLSLCLFGLLIAGMTWSSEDWLVSGRCLLKYRELVYLPMFIVVFQEPRLRRLGSYAFMAGACVLLGMSYFEWLSGADYGISSFEDYIIGKDRIIHSIIMALLAHLAALECVRKSTGSDIGRSAGLRRGAAAVVVVLAAGNVVFMLHGRTGYLALGALTVLFLFERMGRRGVAIACVVLATTALGALSLSTSIRGRIDQTVLQIHSQFGSERKHAPDPRLEFYENTLKLIVRHPLMGTGTGSFRTQYSKLIEHSDDRPTSDPHNEYLNLASQVGIPGALLFVILLSVQWYAAGRLAPTDQQIGRSVVLTIAIGSLFNSLILSVTGGLIYAYFSGLAFAGLSQSQEVVTRGEPGTGDDGQMALAELAPAACDHKSRRAA
jgi:O-antigen ligase